MHKRYAVPRHAHNNNPPPKKLKRHAMSQARDSTSILNLPSHFKMSDGDVLLRHTQERKLRALQPPFTAKGLFDNCAAGPIGNGRDSGRCGQKGGCAVCPICRHELQLVAMSIVPHLLEKLGAQIWMVTVIDPSWQRLIESLSNWSLRKAKASVHRALRSLPSSRAFGAFDISLESGLDEAPPSWAPHLHLLIAGPNKEELRRAFQVRTDVRLAYRPLQIKEVTDLPRAIAYVCKLPGVHRVQFTDNNITGMRKIRLTSRQLRLLRDAWKNYRQSELLIMHGIRFPRSLWVQPD